MFSLALSSLSKEISHLERLLGELYSKLFRE